MTIAEDRDLTNDDRATMAEHALAMVEDGQGQELAVVDLLVNLMHLCDRDGLEFSECLGAAEDHYVTELTDFVVTDLGPPGE
jgi:hypothetical protein